MLFGMLDCALADDLRENVAFAHDLEFFAVDFDFRAAVLAEDHFVTDFHGELAAAARIQKLAWAGRHNLAALWLLLSSVRQHDAASRHLFSLERLDNNTIIKGTKVDFGHV